MIVLGLWILQELAQRNSSSSRVSDRVWAQLRQDQATIWDHIDEFPKKTRSCDLMLRRSFAVYGVNNMGEYPTLLHPVRLRVSIFSPTSIHLLGLSQSSDCCDWSRRLQLYLVKNQLFTTRILTPCSQYIYSSSNPFVNSLSKQKCFELTDLSKPVSNRMMDWGNVMTSMYWSNANASVLIVNPKQAYTYIGCVYF